MFEVTFPFMLCICLLTYQQQMYLSLLPPGNQKGQPFFSVSRNSTCNFSLVTAWTLSGKNPSVSQLDEDSVVHKMEVIVKGTVGTQDYYLAVKELEVGKMAVFLTTDEHSGTHFIPSPVTTLSNSDHNLLDTSKPFFLSYEYHESLYLLHSLKYPDGRVELALAQIKINNRHRIKPPYIAEPVYAIKEGTLVN